MKNMLRHVLKHAIHITSNSLVSCYCVKFHSTETSRARRWVEFICLIYNVNFVYWQAAIASRNISLINTDCFDEVLNRQWYGHLEKTSSTSIWMHCKVLLHLISFGFLAPILLDYRSGDNMKQKVICNIWRLLSFIIFSFFSIARRGKCLSKQSTDEVCIVFQKTLPVHIWYNR